MNGHPTVITGLRVAVDEGHGMSNRTKGVFDPGACDDDSKYQEHGIAHEIADLVRSELNHWGAYTMRPVGIYTTRDEQADQAGCQAYCSIHLDGAKPDTATGMTTYIHPMAGADTLRLATEVHKRVLAASGLPDRGIKRNGFAVLSGDAHAFLLELGFIANDKDLAKVLTRKTLIAHAIATGIVTGMELAVPAAPALNRYDVVMFHADNYTALEFTKALKSRGKAVVSRRAGRLAPAPKGIDQAEYNAQNLGNGIDVAMPEIKFTK